jgi:hypothetical protein
MLGLTKPDEITYDKGSPVKTVVLVACIVVGALTWSWMIWRGIVWLLSSLF